MSLSQFTGTLFSQMPGTAGSAPQITEFIAEACCFYKLFLASSQGHPEVLLKFGGSASKHTPTTSKTLHCLPLLIETTFSYHISFSSTLPNSHDLLQPVIPKHMAPSPIFSGSCWLRLDTTDAIPFERCQIWSGGVCKGNFQCLLQHGKH